MVVNIQEIGVIDGKNKNISSGTACGYISEENIEAKYFWTSFFYDDLGNNILKTSSVETNYFSNKIKLC